MLFYIYILFFSSIYQENNLIFPWREQFLVPISDVFFAYFEDSWGTIGLTMTLVNTIKIDRKEYVMFTFFASI